MANILDYLDWRGDIPFSVDPFNEIDGLILAEFGYMPLEGIVPRDFTIRQDLHGAWERFECDSVADKMRIMSFEQDCELFRKMAGSRRFSRTQLTGYVTRIDTESQTQFSALTCLLEDGTTYVSFRGTDGTIVGWKEDMNLSYMQETGSQSDARAYLNDHFRQHPRPIRVGGHSKGGNLAVYAAAFCEADVRSRITMVQSYDGPGFREEIVESPEYRAVLYKVCSYIPESSVVGMLLNQLAEHTIVKSSASGIMQHLAYNWEVLGRHFVEADGLSKSGSLLNKALSGFISQLDDQERQQLIESFFGVLEASEADTFREINQSKRTSYPAMLRAIRNLTPEQQKLFKKSLFSIARSSKDAVLSENTDLKTYDRPPDLTETAAQS
ncbi:MAG: DUF2974 domain-containing protein [Oscillospiraceae bacterium]|nr:DUF2974 domain-containing protein [Oscillospiraceae bacterium]